ncbi:MAG: magnesium and cobalt transporter [Paraglaciecola psychrophila]|jgi:magnesium and cobalt transporter
MSEDRSPPEQDDKSWLEKIAHAFSSEPKSRQDLLEILRVAKNNDVIDDDAIDIIDGAMKVSQMQAREIMVPRTQMTVLNLKQPLTELMRLIVDSGHSRYPVVGENTDVVLGILLAKDLLPHLLDFNADDFDIASLIRPANVVPESKRLNILLREFRETRKHMAIVIDEYGGVAGLITIEDVLEEIVGEIEDEHDVEPDTFIKKLADNDYIIKALTPIDDFNEVFDCNFSDEEFDTIGGIILQNFGHLPRRNEVATVNGFEFKVLNADNRQVHLLRMSAVNAS